MEKTIVDDIKALREFATEYPAGPTMSMLTGGEGEEGLARIGAVLGAVGSVFSPTKPGYPNRLGAATTMVAPEVARAELAALPVPRQLWDTVLEPLLAMAEQQTDAGLDEALQGLRSATSQPNGADACHAATRAVMAVKPLLGMTESGHYEAAAAVAGDAYRALRGIYHHLKEHDRPWVRSLDDDTGWIRFVAERVKKNMAELLRLRPRELLEDVASPLVTPERRAMAAIRDLLKERDPLWVDDDDGWLERAVTYLREWGGALSSLRERAGSPKDWGEVLKWVDGLQLKLMWLRQELTGQRLVRMARNQTDLETLYEFARECPQDYAERAGEYGHVLEAVESFCCHGGNDELERVAGVELAARELVGAWDGEHRVHRVQAAQERLRTAISTLDRARQRPTSNEAVAVYDRQLEWRRLEKATGWPAGDEKTLVEVLIECWDDRHRLAEAASNLVDGWGHEHDAHVMRALEEELCGALAASPVGSALGKGGRTAGEPESTQGTVSTYSEELEQLRGALTRLEEPRPGEAYGAVQLLEWAEMIERRVAMSLACINGPATDDETSAVDLRARPGDRTKIIGALRTGLGCDVHVKNARGDVLEIHQLAEEDAMPDDVAVAERHADAMVEAWDDHSAAICEALGPYYADDGSGFDYDAMIGGIRKLQAQSEALQRLLSIHEAAWPHDVSVQAAKCVEVLAKSCTSSYCANGLMVAAGGSCPSCGPTAVSPLEPEVGQRVIISTDLIWRTNLTRKARAARCAGCGREGTVKSHLVGQNGPLTCEVDYDSGSAYYVPEELRIVEPGGKAPCGGVSDVPQQTPDPAQGA